MHVVLKECKCITVPRDIHIVKTAFEYFKCLVLQITTVRNATAEELL